MSVAWLLTCQFLLSLADPGILMKQPIRGALLWPTEAYCSPILHPIWGMGTLAASLSFSSPRDGVRSCERFPGPHLHSKFLPLILTTALCPKPQTAAYSWATCFLCWLIFSDWRLLGGDGENEEGFVWLPRSDLRHLCSLSRQNHRLRCHHPDGHALWHSWALWWHQGIHWWLSLQLTALSSSFPHVLTKAICVLARKQMYVYYWIGEYQ